MENYKETEYYKSLPPEKQELEDIREAAANKRADKQHKKWEAERKREEKKTHAHWQYEILKALPDGTQVYTVLEHVSRSGMMRGISMFTILDKEDSPAYGLVTSRPEIMKINIPLVYSWDAKNCRYRVSGCGMDMGYSLVESLSWRIHGNANYFRQEWV